MKEKREKKDKNEKSKLKKKKRGFPHNRSANESRKVRFTRLVGLNVVETIKSWTKYKSEFSLSWQWQPEALEKCVYLRRDEQVPAYRCPFTCRIKKKQQQHQFVYVQSATLIYTDGITKDIVNCDQQTPTNNWYSIDVGNGAMFMNNVAIEAQQMIV
ncbi:hypothetical protein RFI_35853 [Reticulomyxa filosa]|uniref:Uncharacterized protein n=1 Tax=Reticulomyxa filosa TaxID=46433 RepID=X6LKB7_RETFI|nr:hypothetical protein RFI_35853 [Reticulomyxa filosa]|eukprot:ETO01587.1 hypothetical protein RFI_35853 [Reticulomyxa filosa]